MERQARESITEPSPVLFWAAAAFISLALNAALFGLIPGLWDRALKKPKIAGAIPVRVIRLERKEAHPAEREITGGEQIERQRAKTDGAPLRLPVNLDIPARPLHIPDVNTPHIPSPSPLPSPRLERAPLAPPTIKHAYETDELDGPLIPLSQDPPAYPFNARRKGVEGWVKIRFFVNEEGSVAEIQILDAHPPGVFEQSVARTVSSWRFMPGTVSGTPVKTLVQTTIRFTLK
ncbi:energy transducer TonB [Thermodesulfobacteriota bacterium]